MSGTGPKNRPPGPTHPQAKSSPAFFVAPKNSPSHAIPIPESSLSKGYRISPAFSCLPLLSLCFSFDSLGFVSAPFLSKKFPRCLLALSNAFALSFYRFCFSISFASFFFFFASSGRLFSISLSFVLRSSLTLSILHILLLQKSCPVNVSVFGWGGAS
eukprot:c11640_g2_i1.p1 GENE.c11640_g2_i1~~c11640_g2_i1.p1  ORF type:complete len:158 (-),score=1.49 c11640_g2_i1:58-531(-)